MKRRLLDLLACPNDRHFPLELKVAAVSRAGGPTIVCDIYCARHDVELEKTPVDINDCRDCAAEDVLEGELFCPECQGVFKIKDGIPSLLANPAAADQRTGRDKANEMRARDDQAQDYDGLKMLRLLTKVEVPGVLGLLKPGPRDLIVELGAGTGRVTRAVAPKAAEVVAVDFSGASLRRSLAKGEGGSVHFIQADINHLPLRDHIADHAFSCQVFEHLPGTALRNMAVDEAARVIKAAGSFVVSVYRDSWFWRLFGAKEGYHPGGIYYYRMNGAEFKELLGRQFKVKRHIPNVGLYLQMAKCVKEL